MSNENNMPEDVNTHLKKAMEADAEVDRLKAQLDAALKTRSEHLGKANGLGTKKFLASGGRTLTIFRKNEGLWSLKGKAKDEDKNLVSIE